MKVFEFEQVECAGTIYSDGRASSSGFDLYRSGLKRVLDVVLVLVAAPVVILVVVVFAGLIACDGRNPFFCQSRVGHGGRIFRMWKLRSMVHDAEARLQHHLTECPEAAREWSEKQKLSNDPRITRVGRLIRKTSIDELPQVFNVLRGDMSLVGPRPMIESQKPLYPGKSYFRLRPGITGTWQVSDRHTSAFVVRARYDDDYERDLSFSNDLGILLKTVSVVRRCTGI